MTNTHSKNSMQKFYDEYKWMLNVLLALLIWRLATSGENDSIASQLMTNFMNFMHRWIIRSDSPVENTRLFEDLRFEYDMSVSKTPMVFAGIGLLIFAFLLS